MIVTIRKHAKWLLWIIAGATIFSMVYYIGYNPATRGSGGGSRTVDTNTIGGTIYGKKVTSDEYERAHRDVNLYFLFNAGVWADRDPNLTPDQLMQQIYARIMMARKAQSLDIHVSDDQVAKAAAQHLRSPQLLRALGANNQTTVQFAPFVRQVLNPAGLTADDFENFVRDDLAIDQLQLTFGLPGLLITPQEASAEYMKEYQEMSAQIVFFSASNFLSHISLSPQDVGLFYTNYMVNYRVPDRVQVSFVEFSASNYLSQAQKELTNLETQVSAIITQYGTNATPGATTLEEAKAQIRHYFLMKQGLDDAAGQASAFAQAVFNVSISGNKPASVADLVSVARQKGLPVHTPAPFSAEYGPEDFAAPAAFIQQAFELSTNSPLAEPVPGTYSVYVMGLVKNLPAEIPSLDQIRGKVTDDMRLQEATIMAQRAGTNFVHNLFLHMASGKSFAAASVAAGAAPQLLPPFALATQDLPELGGHATMNQLRQAVLTTSPGMPSGFVPTEDGGFVLYVESKMPVDQSKMASELPQFTAELRQQRQSQMFNDWYLREANHELASTPLGHMK
jgi:SurA N-terminal domain